MWRKKRWGGFFVAFLVCIWIQTAFGRAIDFRCQRQETEERMAMGIRHYIVIIMIISFSAGCYEIANSLFPSRYHRDNIIFTYPGNWKVAEDVARNNFRYLFLEGPDGAIMIIHIYLKHHALNLRDFVDRFAGQTEQEIPLGKTDNNYFSTVVRKTTSGSKTGLREKFSLMVGSAQIPHVREYVRMEAKNKVVFFISQAPEKERDGVEPGFDLILTTFSLE